MSCCNWFAINMTTIGLLVVAVSLSAADTGDRPVAEVLRELNLQWVEVQKEREEQRRELARERLLLETNLALLRAERDRLAERREALSVELVELEEEEQALRPEAESYREWAEIWDRSLVRLESDFDGMLRRLPTPLREELTQLDPFLRGPEARVTNPRLQKIRNLVDSLNRIQAFDGAITRRDEVISLDDGTRLAAEVWYLGLGRAWWLGAGTPQQAGYGVPGAEGWEWTVDPDLVRPLQRWKRILQRELPPGWVVLPMSAPQNR